MPYHSVVLKLTDDTNPNRHVYQVDTKYHEIERNHRTSSAYTLASENHEVLRWDSNNAVVPQDIMDATNWVHKDKMNKVRDMEMNLALKAYFKAQNERTPEEIAEQRAEARAAHGPGTTLVNVLTGEKYTT